MSNAATIAKLRSRLGMPAARDTAVYVVISRCMGTPIAAERDVARMNRNDTIADIASGQIEDVQSVFAFNVAEGWSEDCSEDIALQIVEQHAAPWEISGGLRDFIEHACGYNTVLAPVAFDMAVG